MKYRWLTITAIILFVIIFTGSAVALRSWYKSGLAPIGSPKDSQLFTLELGSSSAEVAKQLETRNLIRDQLAFRWYVFTHGLSTKLQAGLYNFHGGLSGAEVAEIISQGATATTTVTVNSGLRLSQIKPILRQAGYQPAAIERALKAKYDYSILADKPAEAALEGYLWPDTYHIGIDQPVGELIELILANTDQKITDDIRQAWKSRGLDLHEGLTLASIVLEEVAKVEDQRQVAQVFLKRLKVGMRLEADPTFKYGASLLGVAPSPDVMSRYNTYKFKGLPPTPIANIELSAAEAVAWPADTNWLYFLSDKNGQTYFTDNETEHKHNIEKYLR